MELPLPSEGKPDEQPRFVDVLVDELIRIAMTTPEPIKFLTHSSDALMLAIVHLLSVNYDDSTRHIILATKEYFPLAKRKALESFEADSAKDDPVH